MSVVFSPKCLLKQLSGWFPYSTVSTQSQGLMFANSLKVDEIFLGLSSLPSQENSLARFTQLIHTFHLLMYWDVQLNIPPTTSVQLPWWAWGRGASSRLCFDVCNLTFYPVLTCNFHYKCQVYNKTVENNIANSHLPTILL